MVSSETIGEVATALANFQATAPPILKAKPVTAGQKRYRYAPLELILDIVREPLAKQGLCVTHLSDVEDGRAVLEARVVHTSGEWLAHRVPVHADQQTLQGLGSALTYLRRYSVLAVLGLAGEEDDDAAAAMRGAAVKAAQRDKAPPESKLRNQIIAHVSQEKDATRMGVYTSKINGHEAAGRLTAEEAKECRAQVAARIAELTSGPKGGKGELFETEEQPAGVGV